MCVVGAGVTGLSVAYHLASAGRSDVVVLDRAGVGGGASAIQPGGVRQQWGSVVNCTLARESFRFYDEVAERLALPVPATLDRGGYAFVALQPGTLEVLRENVAVQHTLGIPSVLLSPSELEALVPGLDPTELVGGAFCAEDGYFDRPQAVIAGFEATARALGVELETLTVTAIRPEGGGWVVECGADGALTCEHVVVAAGCDTVGLLRPLGLEVPIEPSARHLFYSDPVRERLLEPLVVSADLHFAAKQLADGSVLASDLSAIGDDSGIPLWRERVRSGIETLLPILRYVTFPIHVAGHYDLTPDSQMILGPAPERPGLWLAAGLSGRGFMMAPAVGRILADAIVHERHDELLEPLSLTRFSRHALTPEPQVV